jgi:hypothetical protein
MLTLKEIRSALADRRLDVVAEATGLHPNSIARIRDGKNDSPRPETIDALSRYLMQSVKPATGCYMAEIVEAELIKRVGVGQVAVVTYKLFETGKFASVCYVVKSDDEKKQSDGRTSLAGLCRSIGMTRIVNLDELVGKCLRICFYEEIVHKKVQNG